MRFKLGPVLLLLAAWSCDQNPTIVVGRMPRTPSTQPAGVGGTGGTGGETTTGPNQGAFSCSDKFVEGTDGYFWCAYAEPTGAASITETPTTESVSFFAQSPPDVRAGVAFRFNEAGDGLDLSGFGSVTLGLDMTEGEGFELFLGSSPAVGCAYVAPSRSATGEYSMQLRTASWCVPSQCGFDLTATGGLILAAVPTTSTLRARVKSITFSQSPSTFGSASAMSSGIGPGGLCWFIVKWNEGATSSWVPGTVMSNSAHVIAHATGNAVTGMAFEIPAALRLAQYSHIQLTANVTINTPTNSFLVQGVNRTRGLVWRFTPQAGDYVYDLELKQPESWFPSDGTRLGLDEIQRFEIVAPVGGTSDLNANVTAITFVQ